MAACCLEQLVWHVICVELQLDRHTVFAEGFAAAAGTPVAGLGAVFGIRHPVWQLADVALQLIMQFVTVDETIDCEAGGAWSGGTVVCADATPTAAALNAAATTSTATLRIAASSREKAAYDDTIVRYCKIASVCAGHAVMM